MIQLSKELDKTRFPRKLGKNLTINQSESTEKNTGYPGTTLYPVGQESK